MLNDGVKKKKKKKIRENITNCNIITRNIAFPPPTSFPRKIPTSRSDEKSLPIQCKFSNRKINATPIIIILNGRIIQKSQAAVNRCSLTQCQTAKKSCQRSRSQSGSNSPLSRISRINVSLTRTIFHQPWIFFLPLALSLSFFSRWKSTKIAQASSLQSA